MPERLTAEDFVLDSEWVRFLAPYKTPGALRQLHTVIAQGKAAVPPTSKVDVYERNYFKKHRVAEAAAEIGIDQGSILVIAPGGIGQSIIDALLLSGTVGEVHLAGLTHKTDFAKAVTNIALASREDGQDYLGEIVHLDLQEPDSAENLAQHFADRELPCLVIYAAGFAEFTTSEEYLEKNITDLHRRVFEVNYFKFLEIAERFGRLYEERGEEGTILVLGSYAAKMGGDFLPAYVESKAALDKFVLGTALLFQDLFGITLKVFDVGARYTGFQPSAGIPIEELPGDYYHSCKTAKNVVAFLRSRKVYDAEPSNLDKVLSRLYQEAPNLAIRIFYKIQRKIEESLEKDPFQK